jgi:hypothetical protein
MGRGGTGEADLSLSLTTRTVTRASADQVAGDNKPRELLIKAGIKLTSEEDGQQKLTRMLEADYSVAPDSLYQPREQFYNTCQSLEQKLTEQFGPGNTDGVSRIVFFDDDKVIKMPKYRPTGNQRLNPSPADSLLAQYCEQANINNNQKLDDHSLAYAEGELVYTEQGVPLMIMDRVDPIDISSLQDNSSKDRIDFDDYSNTSGMDSFDRAEKLTQVGWSNQELKLYDGGDYQEHLDSELKQIMPEVIRQYWDQ